MVHLTVFAGYTFYLDVEQRKQPCTSSSLSLGRTHGLSGGLCLNSELRNSSKRRRESPAGQRRVLTVPGWQWKLTSSRTWATRTAKDRLAWMW